MVKIKMCHSHWSVPRYCILPQRLCLYNCMGVCFTLVGTGSELCSISILCLCASLPVCACVVVCGCSKARPSPAVLFGSVDLHSKLYMLVFTFCFSNKIPWTKMLLVIYENDLTCIYLSGFCGGSDSLRWLIRASYCVWCLTGTNV